MIDPQDYGLMLFGVVALVVISAKAAFDSDIKRSNEQRSAKNFLKVLLDRKRSEGSHCTTVKGTYSNTPTIKYKGHHQMEMQTVGHINSNKNKKRKKRK